MSADIATDDPRLIEIALHRPQKLYKYRSLDGDAKSYAKDLVVNSKLFFSPPSRFNDPLDCKIPPLFEASREEVEQFWRDRWARRGGVPPGREEQLPRVLGLHETEEGRQQLAKVYQETVDGYGVACLNARPDSFLMWSYYASSHSGIVVRFDTRDEFLPECPQPSFLLPVEYSKDFPMVSFYEPDRLSMVIATLGTKAEAWDHEEEWRFILVGRSGPFTMPNGMVDGVILGLRTSPQLEEEVRGWIAEAGRDIELMRVQHKPLSFELEVVPA